MKIAEISQYLLRLSNAKLVLMNNLLNATQKQHQILETDDVEGLNKLIEEKQIIIEKIDLLDREFVEKYALLKENLGVEVLQEVKGEDIPYLKELQEKLGEILVLLKKIDSLDKENTEKLKNNIDNLKKNLKNIKVGQKIVKGYNLSQKESPSIFIDKKK